MKPDLIFVVALLLSYPCSVYGEISQKELRTHLTYLASDRLQGRKGGTIYEKKAARYIKKCFRQYGLQPPKGGFLQSFPLYELKYLKKFQFELFSPYTSKRAYHLENKLYPLSFSGSGTASGFLTFVKNSFFTLGKKNLRNKIAVLLHPTPSHPRSLAKKILALQNAGASGVIVLQNSLSKQSRGKILLTYRQLQWLNYLAKSGNFLRSVLSLYLPGASKTGALDLNVLWKAHPQRLKSTPLALLSLKQDPWPLNDQHLLRKIRIPLVWGKQNLAKRLFSPLSKPHRSIKTWARFHIQIEVEKKFSQNVIGIRRGDHPQLRHQAIVIGAHYDHIGATRSIFQALGKDTVWNGADDNASGTAALLALAKAAMEKNRKFPRTLIFVAFGAEEYGLLGSQYYVRHPVFPLKHTVAMLNLDMVGRGTNKLLFVGGSSSSPPLKKLLKRANQKVQLRIVYTDWGIRRSDQWPFLTRHIPALFFTSGPHLDYHELSDEVDKINFLKLQKISQLALYTLHSLAKWPKPLPRAKPK